MKWKLGDIVTNGSCNVSFNPALSPLPQSEYEATGWRLAIRKRSHKNTPSKTARERAAYVINRGAMAEDIEKQIQLAVKAYAKRKANRK